MERRFHPDEEATVGEAWAGPARGGRGSEGAAGADTAPGRRSWAHGRGARVVPAFCPQAAHLVHCTVPWSPPPAAVPEFTRRQCGWGRARRGAHTEQGTLSPGAEQTPVTPVFSGELGSHGPEFLPLPAWSAMTQRKAETTYNRVAHV